MCECVSVHVCLFLPVLRTCRWKGRMLFEFMSTYIFTVCACGNMHIYQSGDQKRSWIGFWRLGWEACGWVIINYDSCRLRFYPAVGDLWDISWAGLADTETIRNRMMWHLMGPRWGKSTTFISEHRGWSVALIQYITSINMQFLIKVSSFRTNTLLTYKWIWNCCLQSYKQIK